MTTNNELAALIAAFDCEQAAKASRTTRLRSAQDRAQRARGWSGLFGLAVGAATAGVILAVVVVFA